MKKDAMIEMRVYCFEKNLLTVFAFEIIMA